MALDTRTTDQRLDVVEAKLEAQGNAIRGFRRYVENQLHVIERKMEARFEGLESRMNERLDRIEQKIDRL